MCFMQHSRSGTPATHLPLLKGTFKTQQVYNILARSSTGLKRVGNFHGAAFDKDQEPRLNSITLATVLLEARKECYSFWVI